MVEQFTTQRVSQVEAKYNIGVLDVINKVSVINVKYLICMGNVFPKGANELDEAQKILDDYIASDKRHSLLTAYAQLGRKITKDLRIMNSAVKGFKDMEKEILETEAEAAEQLKEAKEDM